MKKLMYFFTIFFMCVSMAYGGSVALEWDANKESDLVVGYRIHWGESTRVYDHVIDVKNVTQYTVNDLALEQGKTYYFAATAYDESNNESEFSNELVVTIDNEPPAAPGNVREVKKVLANFILETITGALAKE